MLMPFLLTIGLFGEPGGIEFINPHRKVWRRVLPGMAEAIADDQFTPRKNAAVLVSSDARGEGDVCE